MSQQSIIKALVDLGLSKTDARTYVRLALGGPYELERLSLIMRISENEIRKSLEVLGKLKVVVPLFESSELFFAVPIKHALEVLIVEQEKTINNIEQNKDRLLKNWQEITSGSTKVRQVKFN